MAFGTGGHRLATRLWTSWGGGSRGGGVERERRRRREEAGGGEASKIKEESAVGLGLSGGHCREGRGTHRSKMEKGQEEARPEPQVRRAGKTEWPLARQQKPRAGCGAGQ